MYIGKFVNCVILTLDILSMCVFRYQTVSALNTHYICDVHIFYRNDLIFRLLFILYARTQN